MCNQRRKSHNLHAAIELNHTTFTTAALELLFKATDIDRLTRRESRKSQRQSKERSAQNQSQVDRHDHLRTSTKPIGFLKTNQDQRGQDHDRGGVQDTGDGSFANGESSGLFTLSETLDGLCVWVCLALGALGLGEDGIDVDSAADFLAAHEEDVEGGCGGHGSEGDETREDQTGVWADALEAGDQGVQTHGYRAGC